MNATVFLTVFLLSLAGIGAAVLAMGIGPIFGRRCLRGSCGGTGAGAGHDDRIACVGCPNAPPAPASGDAEGAAGSAASHHQHAGLPRV